MKSICCVCGKILGYKPGDGISHGYCDICAADTLNEPGMWEVWYRENLVPHRIHIRACNSTQAQMRTLSQLSEQGIRAPHLESVKPIAREV